MHTMDDIFGKFGGML